MTLRYIAENRVIFNAKTIVYLILVHLNIFSNLSFCSNFVSKTHFILSFVCRLNDFNRDNDHVSIRHRRQVAKAIVTHRIPLSIVRSASHQHNHRRHRRRAVVDISHRPVLMEIQRQWGNCDCFNLYICFPFIIVVSTIDFVFSEVLHYSNRIRCLDREIYRILVVYSNRHRLYRRLLRINEIHQRHRLPLDVLQIILHKSSLGIFITNKFLYIHTSDRLYF